MDNASHADVVPVVRVVTKASADTKAGVDSKAGVAGVNPSNQITLGRGVKCTVDRLFPKAYQSASDG